MVKSSAHCLWERAARLSGSHPSCLKPTAAAANSGSLLGSDPRKWHLFTAPHGVQSLLTSESTQHFSASRLTSYGIHLLSPVNLHLWPSRVLTLLCNQPRLTQVCPGCAVTTSSFVTLWSNFTSSFPNTDLILSVNTSGCRNEKRYFQLLPSVHTCTLMFSGVSKSDMPPNHKRISPAAPIFTRYLEQPFQARRFVFRIGWKLNGSQPEQATIPVNKSIVVPAWWEWNLFLTRFISVCGGYHSPGSSECLDSWCTTRECLFRFL